MCVYVLVFIYLKYIHSIYISLYPHHYTYCKSPAFCWRTHPFDLRVFAPCIADAPNPPVVHVMPFVSSPAVDWRPYL